MLSEHEILSFQNDSLRFLADNRIKDNGDVGTLERISSPTKAKNEAQKEETNLKTVKERKGSSFPSKRKDLEKKMILNGNVFSDFLSTHNDLHASCTAKDTQFSKTNKMR